MPTTNPFPPQKYWGPLFILLYTALTVLVFIAQPLSESPVPVPADAFTNKKTAEGLAATAMVLMGFGLILAARFRFLERWFGGLDRMYNVHKILGIISIWLLIAHFILIPEFDDAGALGGITGKVSLVGFTLLILLTVIRKVPYHRWFPTHRFMGVFYIVGIIHTMVADNMIISALRDPAMAGKQVDFFYTVRSESDALFLDEIKQHVAQQESVNFHLICSDQGERLTADRMAEAMTGDFAERSLFLCGPAPMVKTLRQQAKAKGMPTSAIHFEKFAIR